MFSPDPGAVSIRNLDAVELDAVDLDIGPGNDPERLPFRIAAVGESRALPPTLQIARRLAVQLATSPR